MLTAAESRRLALYAQRLDNGARDRLVEHLSGPDKADHMEEWSDEQLDTLVASLVG